MRSGIDGLRGLARLRVLDERFDAVEARAFSSQVSRPRAYRYRNAIASGSKLPGPQREIKYDVREAARGAPSVGDREFVVVERHVQIVMDRVVVQNQTQGGSRSSLEVVCY